MAATTIQKDSINARFYAALKRPDTTIVDLTNLNVATFVFLSPTAVRKTMTGSVYGDPTDGIVEYYTETGDLDEVGTWKTQVKLEFLDGSILYTTVDKFKVKDNI